MLTRPHIANRTPRRWTQNIKLRFGIFAGGNEFPATQPSKWVTIQSSVTGVRIARKNDAPSFGCLGLRRPLTSPKLPSDQQGLAAQGTGLIYYYIKLGQTGVCQQKICVICNLIQNRMLQSPKGLKSRTVREIICLRATFSPCFWWFPSWSIRQRSLGMKRRWRPPRDCDCDECHSLRPDPSTKTLHDLINRFLVTQNESGRRLFAGLVVQLVSKNSRLNPAIRLTAKITGLDRRTIKKGFAELKSDTYRNLADGGRIRHEGGGRKPLTSDDGICS